MDKAAVESAHACLGQAKEAVTSMQQADNLDKLEKGWTDFLIMANRVYTKLEQGAKSNGTSKGWFGRKKHERRKDPLLSYIKNARDADEHGIERVTERKGGGVAIKFPEGTVVEHGHIRSGPTGADIAVTLREPPASPTHIHVFPASLTLVEVTNYGDKYPPPSSTNPIQVAQRMVSLLDGLISEAESLIQ
jgi:hypothetical protein